MSELSTFTLDVCVCAFVAERKKTNERWFTIDVLCTLYTWICLKVGRNGMMINIMLKLTQQLSQLFVPNEWHWKQLPSGHVRVCITIWKCMYERTAPMCMWYKSRLANVESVCVEMETIRWFSESSKYIISTNWFFVDSAENSKLRRCWDMTHVCSIYRDADIPFSEVVGHQQL